MKVFFKRPTTKENIKKVLDIIMEDRRLRVNEIAKVIGISEGQIQGRFKYEKTTC